MTAIISKRIISTINALFFIILIILVVTTASLLLWLKQGIYFDSVTIFEHKISRLYIKWDKKITFKVQSIEKLGYSSNKDIKVPNLDLILRIAYNALEKIEIHYLKMDDFKGSINYIDQKFDIKSNLFDLKTQYTIEPSKIVTKNFDLHFHDLDLTMTGKGYIDKDEDAFYLNSNFVLSDELQGDLKLKYQNNTLYLESKTADFPSLEFIKKFVTLSDKVSPWVYEKLKVDTFEVKEVRSHFSFNYPKQFFQNLEVNAKLINFTYKFSDNLYPIVAKDALVHYKYGNLEIVPNKPLYHNKAIDGTNVSLLYLVTKPTLSLVLRNKGQLDEEIIEILKNYEIPFPLIQKSGQSDMSLDLTMDLDTKEKNYAVKLNFLKSDLQIGYFNLFIDQSNIEVTNGILKISDTFLNDEDLNAHIEGEVDLLKDLGDINVSVHSINLNLIHTQKPFDFQVRLKEDATIIETQDSQWAFLNGYPFSLLSRQYVLTKEQKLEIPSIHLYDPKHLDIFFNGFIDFKHNTYDLSLLLNNIILARDENNQSMQLLHPVQFRSNPKTKGSFESNRPLILSNGKDEISINKVSFISNKNATLKMDKIRYKDLVKTDILAHYNAKTKMGDFNFNNIKVDINQTDPAYLQFDVPKISFVINNKEKLRVFSPQLKTGYKRQNEEHIFHVDDISALSAYSPFLQSIHDHKGKVFVKTKNFKEFTLFSKLKDVNINGFINEHIDKSVDISGSINKQGIQATINDKLSIAFGKDINITLKDTGFDLQPLFQESNTTKKKSYSTPINVVGSHGFLVLGKKNQLIFDNFQANTQKRSFYANLQHKKGQAILFSEKKKLEIYGENFNDAFIGNLLGFKGFKGGTYSFYIKENKDKGMGGIHIEDATIKDFALYNNLLAYLNTIPALLTFNSPGFNAEGFTVNKGDIGFTKENDLITINSLKFFGRSSNIFGEGTLDLDKSTVDMTVRIFLLKDIGTIISSIPIAGYLLLGDDGSLTTTLTITGPIKDPDISVNLGKDILMAPINIIKRTFSLPARLLEWMTGDDKEKKDNP